MVISQQVIAKRHELARDILNLQSIMHKFMPLADIGSLNAAISTLKNGKPIECPYEDLKPTYWGYKISKLIFKLDSGVPKKLKPSSVKDLKLIVNIHVVGNCEVGVGLNDPLLWLALDFKIEGEVIKDDKIAKVLTCYHLDRHIKNEDDGDNEPHPFYHFQFGGRHLLNIYGELDTGDLIVSETPRISHHPMDLILSIDYLLSYFFPTKRKEMIKKSREYVLLLKKYQDAILKPYYHTLSNHWKFEANGEAINNPLWNPVSIHPQIV